MKPFNITLSIVLFLTCSAHAAPFSNDPIYYSKAVTLPRSNSLCDHLGKAKLLGDSLEVYCSTDSNDQPGSCYYRDQYSGDAEGMPGVKFSNVRYLGSTPSLIRKQDL